MLSYITNAATCFDVSAASLAIAVSKLPVHGAETPKHVGAFVIKYNLIFNMHLFVHIISKFDFSRGCYIKKVGETEYRYTFACVM